jgi:hypothetical protein
MRWAVLAFLVSAAPAWACFFAGPPPVSATIEAADGKGGIRAAAYIDQTNAYGHDIMGRVPDARALRVIIVDEGGTACVNVDRVDAGKDHVFEDTAPRLADVDGDGRAEIIAVRSSFTQGAQLVVYTLRDGSLEILAATPYIGQRNRWLAPAAVGDLDGDGHVEIAYVDRPHLAKVLRIWRYADGDFREVADAGGVTNHAIGDEVIHGGLRDCGDGPEIVLSDAGRARMLAVRYDGAAISARDIGTFSAQAALDAVACR